MSLTERSISGVKWNYLGVATRIVSQTVVQIAFARLLGAEALGLFALAFLVIGVTTLVTELGLGAALVQRATVTKEDVRAVYSRVLMASLLAAVVLYICAPLAAVGMGDPRVGELLRALLPLIVLQALGVTSLSILRRELAFKCIQIIQVGSYLVGFVLVGLPMAILGYGTNSLVIAWLAQACIASSSYFFLRPHSMIPTIGGGDKGVNVFGLKVLLTNVSNWFIENIDNFLVGRFFGANALGYYSVSYNFVRNPSNHIVVALQNVLFPASARAQDNLQTLRRAYLAAVSGVALTALPIFGGVATTSETVVHALFGAAWSPAAPMLSALSVAMVFHSLMAIAGPVLWGKGAAAVELRVQLASAVLLIASLLIAGKISPIAVAWTVCGVYALRFCAMTVALARHIDLGAIALLRALRGGAIVGLTTASLLVVLDRALLSFDPAHRLLILMACAGAWLCSFIVLLPKLALSEDLAYALVRLLSPMRKSDALQRRIRAAFPSLNTRIPK